MTTLASLGPTVKVINRLVDAGGQKVPYEAYVDGTVLKIVDEAYLPAGVARIIVHNSMYAIDPISHEGQYKLGVEAWGLPIAPLLPAAWQRGELIERSALGPTRQFGALDSKTGKRLQAVKIRNDVGRRHDPISVNAPGPRQDGAHPGGFGDAFAR